MSTSRSDRRQRAGVAPLAALAGGCAILAALAAPGSAGPRPGPPPAAGLRRVGSFSCSARGCHGAVGPTDPARGEVYIKDGSYTTWRAFDPHARAFEVLREPRSRGIAARLEKTLGTSDATKARACLACHATVSPPESVGGGADLADGVSCEACHGPAEAWQEKHVESSWTKDPSLRAREGMGDLSDAAGRAGACVGCHVGDRSRGMDVNHDLIAAGHPRLNFEFSAYLASYPKHWREDPSAPPDAEARSWVVGQLVTARAGLVLLADRARDSQAARPEDPSKASPWPELSESECFACHHSLAKPGWLPDRGPMAIKPGRLPWATWDSAMLPDLKKVRADWDFEAPGSPWVALRAEMSRGAPDPGKVAALAEQGVKVLDGRIAEAKGLGFDSARVAALLKELPGGGAVRAGTWDQEAQRHLARAAMARAGKALGVDPGLLKEADAALEAGRKRLGFPPGFDSPKGGRPSADAPH